MARRDVFSTLRQIPQATEETPAALLSEGQSEARQPLDLIPTAQRRKKRSREWERARRAETVTYRGVPPAYHEWMGKLADGLDVPRDEVARALLEYSLGLYQSGRLVLHARPKAQRMTLYPQHKNSTPTFPSPTRNKPSGCSRSFLLPVRKRPDGKRASAKTPNPAAGSSA
jgi:hypothetical protein